MRYGIELVETFRGGKKDNDGFFHRPPKSVLVWTFFVNIKRRPLYEAVARKISKRFPNVDIALVLEPPPRMLATATFGEELMAERSDMVFIDTAYPHGDSRGCESYLIHRLAWRMGVNSFVVFCQNEMERNALADSDEFNFERRHGRKRKLPLENLIILPKEDGDAQAEVLATQIEETTSHYYGKRTFLCHASEDRQFSRRLAEELVLRGIPVWYDEWSLRVGDSLVARINQGIGESKYMGVVLSKHSVDKPWCVKEMNAALQIQLSDQGVTILPIIVDDCTIPPLFADLIWADFRSSFEWGLDQLFRCYGHLV